MCKKLLITWNSINEKKKRKKELKLEMINLSTQINRNKFTCVKVVGFSKPKEQKHKTPTKFSVFPSHIVLNFQPFFLSKKKKSRGKKRQWKTDLEKLLGIIGYTIRDQNHHVLLGSSVPYWFPEDSDAQQELISVQESNVSLLRRLARRSFCAGCLNPK